MFLPSLWSNSPQDQLEIGNRQLAIRMIPAGNLAEGAYAGRHEACQAICRRRIFIGLLCRDRRGTGPVTGRPNGQGDRNDAISIPTPGELFAALEKPGKPNWVGQMRGPIATSYKNRAQIALNLGSLIADGFIAVEAKDSQQVKNIGTDIIKMAKALGVSENVLSRGNSINEFAENDEWDALQEELEATQNEVKSSMQSHRDQDLIILVSVGGWIRGTQVVSAAVMQNYDERAAKVLRQPALVNFIQS